MKAWLLPVPEDIRADHALISAIVRDAGAIALEAFETNDYAVWHKGKNHPVSDADIKVNAFLKTHLLTAQPNYGWLSEETKDDSSRHKTQRSFVVDPIDGTRAFIQGKPHFTVSVAVIEDGLPLVGVVYNPATGEFFDAIKGGGARLNNTPISPRTCDAITGCTVIGRPDLFKKFKWPKLTVISRNSMAYRICLVAAGQADACVAFTPKSDWDLAAAHLIAQEAGAIITDRAGGNLSYNHISTRQNGVICAGPQLHPALLQQTRQSVTPPPKTEEPKMTDSNPNQFLHIVFGGELVDPQRTEFKDISNMEFVGAYASYADAQKAWKSAAQRTVDNAHMRFFILHAHKLIDPDGDGIIG